MTTKYLPLVIIPGVLACGAAMAEHPHDHDDSLSKILVTAPVTTPVANAHLGPDAIRDKRAQTSDTASLLEGVAGMSVYQGGGAASLPFMRGFADDRLRVKVDGMDLISACANHMNPPLSYISPSRVEDIQVYSAVAPVSLGGDSIGGTIIANSAKPEFANSPDEVIQKGEISTYYRSNGDARGGSLSASIANDRFSFRYDGSTSKANNYDAGDSFKAAGNDAVDRGALDADEVGSTAYETRNHAVDLAYKLTDKQLLQLKLAHQDIPYQAWPNQRMDMVENRSNQVNLIYSGEFDWGSIETNLFHEKTHHKMQFGDDKQFLYGTAQGMPMETEGENTGLSVKTEIPVNERDLIRVGADIQRYRLDDFWEASGGMMMAPDTFLNINNGERDRYGVYGEWEAAWTDKWLTLAGIRHETVKMDADEVQGYNAMYAADADAFNNADRSQTDHNIDLTLLARYTPNLTESYEFGYARKTRSPNLYERFAWSRNGMAMRMVNLVGDGNGYVGNVELDPEVAHTISFTANWHDAAKQDWQVTLTPYFSYVDNFIDATRCAGGMGMMAACSAGNLTVQDSFVNLQYDNVSARIFGADLAVYKHLFHNSFLGRVDGSATLSFVRGENRDSGDDLYNMMPMNARFTLAQSKNKWRNSFEWELVDAKDRVNNERNEIETAGYGLLHFRTSYEFDNARIEVGIENLLDKGYSHPLSGAYVGQGATMGTAIPWGVTVPGMGRSIYAGLSYSF
ncbi:TonB-dependent receptor [Methylophaga sp. OBS3]|uniref:TonB-dependent receptor n=1 Tax=Methylophaga sp. OBS3 TaxID=2991934 RepID=UPI00225B8BF5|nr:TonB-dependent receptor [Methylophaga sp. OBS3]MCX4189895.1 TonB-dependent receptor [Methylophaga sp. OBS3]